MKPGLSATLPPGQTIELSVRLLDEATGETIREAIISIDRGNVKRAQLGDMGIAIQAGSYEALLAVWPRADQSPPT